jgi:hypothetical protein
MENDLDREEAREYHDVEPVLFEGDLQEEFDFDRNNNTD